MVELKKMEFEREMREKEMINILREKNKKNNMKKYQTLMKNKQVISILKDRIKE